MIEDSTDARAEATKQWLEDEVDKVAVRNFVDSLKRSSFKGDFVSEDFTVGDDPWAGVGKEMFMRIALGIGAWQIVGSYESVAERIRELSDAGIESILICFFDPLGGLHHMEDEIIPILKKMGLRK